MTALWSLDDFPTGLVVTTLEDRKIIFANQYFYHLSGYDAQNIEFIGNVFTAASKIVIESFMMPMLLHQGRCEEIQLTLETQQLIRVPVLINACIVTKHNQMIYWKISTAQQRDSLYQELVNLRNDLEERAEKLEVLSQTDELTALLNRRAFVSQSRALIKQCDRHQLLCAFMMLDIDHFKQVNDQHGHDIGDAVLRAIGVILRNNVREDDVLARIGGEEFAICLICDNTDAPIKFAEKLLASIRAQHIEGLSITMSIGIAMSYQANFEDLYKSADQMLYQAKHQGRNQLVSMLMKVP